MTGPMRHPARLIVVTLLAVAGLALPALGAPQGSFADFVHQFEPQALAAGVTDSTYAAAMQGIAPDPVIEKLVTAQPEFATPIWDYLDRRVSDRRIRDGRAAFKAHRALFERIGKRFGVDPYVLAAIWGIETSYGAVLDNPALIKPVVRSLATLVYLRRGRVDLDARELIAALLIVQQGPRDARTLVGSWAGALGHLQVGPSVFLAHRTDGDGDGVADVQSSLADALATSAAYLISLGYTPGLDWGFEVEVPKGFDYRLASRDTLRPISFFAARGVTRVMGRVFADPSVPVFLYVPAGKTGPKFLMTKNYLVLKGYNFSDSYALAVAHLTDRLKGGGPFVGKWPRDTRFPDRAERMAIQERLAALGLYDGAVDGRIGPKTQAAYQLFQASRGEVADGFITLDSYKELAAAK